MCLYKDKESLKLRGKLQFPKIFALGTTFSLKAFLGKAQGTASIGSAGCKILGKGKMSRKVPKMGRRKTAAEKAGNNGGHLEWITLFTSEISKNSWKENFLTKHRKKKPV